MAGKSIDSSNPFPNPSSAVSMMFNSQTGMRQIYTDERETFCLFVPFDTNNQKGVYPDDPFAFDETMNPAKESMSYWLTFQYMMTLISQNVGTPFLKQGVVANPDLKYSDYQKLLTKAKNYEDNNNVFRSTFFRSTVAERVAQIQVMPLDRPTFTDGDDDTSLTIGQEIYNGYKREGSNLYVLNTKLGVYDNSPRAKFDIIFMPLYKHPEKQNYDDRQIFGFMAIFILFDPLWDMREAIQVFVHQYNNWRIGAKNHVEFNSDPRVLDSFHQNSYARFYADHFKNYIQIDDTLSHAVESKGIDLNPDSDNKLSKFLQFEIALKHAAKHVGASEQSNWYKCYSSITQEKRGWFSFKPLHDPYLYDYHTFLWNSKNQFSNINKETINDQGLGIFYEYFPWITLHKRILSSELVGFERIHTSLLGNINAVDAMDIDEEPTQTGNYYVNQLYTDTYEKLMNINTNKEETFIHSEHNALVAVAERARNDIQFLYKQIENYRTSHPKLENWLFPKHKDGLQSLTEAQVAYVNTSLEELEVHNTKLRQLQARLLKFVVKRILTLSTTKPLTASILATIQYIFGKTLKTKLPGNNQSTLDVNDAIPLNKRNISQYKLNMIADNLDITAHGAMYFVTSTRYFGYNAFCTFDTFKLQIGLMDAFRSEFNLHWNFGSFGPFGTSKSHALEVFKGNCLPKIVTNITTQSAFANAASRDMSDRIRIMDEGSSLLSTNGKPGASYSPEAAAIKSEMTTGLSERHILDVGKNYAERTTRHIISIQIGCIAACSNILITDQALMSRFHTTITENESDRLKTKDRKNTSNVGNTPQEILERQKKERNRVNLSDMILHTPSDMTKKTSNFFTDSMQIQQCMGILIWKFIQMGILRRPSTHIVCVVAIICKYLKTTMNISVPVRTVQRIILFAMNLAVITSVNTLFNAPGIHEELHNVPFKMEMLMKSASYLYCTLQMILLSFSMHSCEFLRHTDNLIVEGIVEHLKIKMFPTQRINALFKFRNIERTKQDNPLYATINTIDKTDLSLVENDPLWIHFRDMDTVPLEFLYVENHGSNPLSTFWRINMLPGAQRETQQPNKPKKVTFFMAPQNNQQQPPQPQGFPTMQENGGDDDDSNNNNAADSTTLVDLAYFTTGLPRAQLLDLLTRHFKNRINADQVSSSFQEIETTKITARTVLPMTKKELKEYQRTYYKAVEDKVAVLPLLPRHEREMNCMEVDSNQNICVCAFMFSEILNRPGNNNVILQAIKSFMYQGLKERTLLTGSELSDNYDIEFSMHTLRKEEIKQSAEKYLRITDPSLINASMESQNRSLVEKITTTMRNLATARDKIYDAALDKMAKLNTVDSKKNKLEKTNLAVMRVEARAVSDNMDQIETDANVDFATLVSSSPKVTVTPGHLDQNSNHAFTDLLDDDTGGSNDYSKIHQSIYGDIDDWAFVNNCLENAIPLRIDPVNRVYLFKTDPNDPASKWEPIHTPLQLIEYHKKAQHADFIETTLIATKQPATDTASSSNFTDFFQTNQSSQKRKRPEEEQVESRPELKKTRKGSISRKSTVKQVIFGGNLDPVPSSFIREDSRTLGEDAMMIPDNDDNGAPM